MKKILFITLSIFFLVWFIFTPGCNTFRYHIYSDDNKQCITIISNKNVRFIINGKHYFIPDTGYVKLDISRVNSDVGDFIVGCFNHSGYKWDIINPRTKVLKNKLDTSLYRVKQNLPEDEEGFPTSKDYRGTDCFGMNFYYKRLRKNTTRGDAIVK